METEQPTVDTKKSRIKAAVTEEICYTKNKKDSKSDKGKKIY